jgi:integrase
MALTDTTVKNSKPEAKQYRLADGQAMYLLVKPNGKKYWRLDYTLHGKRKTYAIGPYPIVSLKKAREKRDEAKRLIFEGIDPVQQRQQVKLRQVDAAKNSFQSVALDWFLKNESAWTKGHSRTISGRLDLNLLPWLGKRPISEITAPEILRVLRRVENRGAIETAHRCKTIVSQVFRYAIATGVADRDPAADLKGALSPTQPKRMAAITDPDGVADLLRAISGYQGGIVTRCALKFSAMTFGRPGEIRHAEWSEINWIKKEWLILGDKMKSGRDHTVPISNQVMEVLREIHPLTGQGRYIFPSLRTGSRPMSNNTVLAALRRMGFTKEEMTPHGFRSMASTLLHENGWKHEIIELQLAHSRRDKVSAAYDRSRRLPERKVMMQWWADLLQEIEFGESASLQKKEVG